MAQWKSSVIDDIKGRIAGVVFQGTLNSGMMRKRTKPRNPKTKRQTQVRGVLAALASTYASLTVAQVDEWMAAAKNITGSNRVGLPKRLTGITFFNKVNGNRAKVGVSSPLLTPPTLVPFPSLQFEEITLVVNSGDIAADVTMSGNVPTGYSLSLYLSDGVRPTITNAPYRLLGYANGTGSASTLAIVGPQFDFTNMTTGRVTYYKVELTNRETGQSVVVGTGRYVL